MPPPSTVTQTVTITEGGSGPYYPTTTLGYPITSKYITTVDGTVTSVNYDGESKSRVWVYPTGTGNKKHCTVATYENDIVIDVNIVDIMIIIIDGFHVTKTATVTDSITYTPTPPIQATTTSPHSTETDNSYGEIHHVTVGDKGLNVYSPNQIDANVGDIIRFKFLARNHTVTQSNFNTPATSTVVSILASINSIPPTQPMSPVISLSTQTNQSGFTVLKKIQNPIANLVWFLVSIPLVDSMLS